MVPQPGARLSGTVPFVMSGVRPLAAMLAVATLAAPLSGTAAAARPSPIQDVSTAQAGTFTARGSVEQVAVTGAAPGTHVRLVDRGGTVVASGIADQQGAFL